VSAIDELFARTRSENRAALVGYLPAGFPDKATSIAAIEAMIDGGVALGLSRQTATELVVQTLIGSGAMLAKSPERTVELRAAVTSPAGTTAAAVRSFERSGLRSTIIEGLFAAHDRSVQQGRTKE